MKDKNFQRLLKGHDDQWEDMMTNERIWGPENMMINERTCWPLSGHADRWVDMLTVEWTSGQDNIKIWLQSQHSLWVGSPSYRSLILSSKAHTAPINNCTIAALSHPDNHKGAQAGERQAWKRGHSGAQGLPKKVGDEKWFTLNRMVNPQNIRL